VTGNDEVRPATAGRASSAAVDGEPLLRLQDIGKNFGPVRALTDIDLDIPAGQVTALVGDNGAGKSTLIKTVSGICAPYHGTVTT
jgi:D-xylose transport system ATP-binding protein